MEASQDARKRVETIYTPKINMELPKNEGLEDDFPFQTGDCRVPCQTSGCFGKLS